jgi:hypothetical protein
MAAMTLRNSVKATYDSRETGPRYHVTTRINDHTLVFREPVPDPFVRTTVTIRSWRDLLLGLLRRRIEVEVIVGADTELMDDVLELDENTLIHGRTREAAFQQSMHGGLAAFGEDS